MSRVALESVDDVMYRLTFTNGMYMYVRAKPPIDFKVGGLYQTTCSVFMIRDVEVLS